ncbi:hypothetical protein [Streptomyces sp. MJM1172]|uniref:hypothetical protein n=1 Tax=Streptomyces sp. MJM1172 TaxID=1703926 RepID=UPI0013015814|nr:hypothetical protein [Streptomyces sp. MJM1172]
MKSTVRDVNSSDMLLGNQIINATGLRDEVDAAGDDWVGPAPKEQPQPGDGR